VGIPRFIVGTGRCGSTLLGTLMGTHPSVLNISELFSSVQPGAFPAGDVTGERFWTMLSRPKRAWSVFLSNRLEPPELLYPVDGAGIFDRRSGVAPIAAVCLPTLSDDPDSLYLALEDVVRRFPSGPVAALYGRLIEWLAIRFGKPDWLERSGGSLAYASDIAARFPAARFVHIYRDGHDTAVSMSRHPFFRMMLIREILIAELGHDPYEHPRPDAESRVPANLAPLMPDTFDPRAFWALDLPLELFGRRWSATVIHGTGQLARTPGAEVCHVSLATLASEPRETLRRILGFLELAVPRSNWFEAAAARVGASVPGSPPAPSRSEVLLRACRPGERWLAVRGAS
jgi:hypothetical protein